MPALFWSIFNSIQALFVLGWTSFWITVALISWAVTFGNHRIAFWLSRKVWTPGLLIGAGARLEVQGLERVDFSRHYLFVANHLSFIDICVLFAALPTNFRFLVKKELTGIPFLGWYIKMMGFVEVDRGGFSGSKKVFKDVERKLRAGQSIVSFAEGTRSRDGKVSKFRRAGFIAPIRAQVPVVPVAIEGADRVLPSDGFKVRPGLIRVRVGDPIPTVGLESGDREELAGRAEAVVEKFYLEMKDLND